MKKEINISGNNHQGTFDLSQSDSNNADAGKISWHSPKLRTLKVSQETLASSGTPPLG